jgi:hypothetical protein
MRKDYRFLNNLFGWLSFAIAAIVYLLTIEPTASFWDCGEFITTSFRLEVGHPPGAPFFMILGRLFTMFAGDVTNVAKMINAMSAMASAFTILFLFWSITHLAKKLVIKIGETPSLVQTMGIMGAGLVGALAYTFSDTFWFSAVEGEVYATSSLITAIVFWAILKWEEVADEPNSNRWLVLIAYIVGLSIGVHLLNLLAIPAIVFVYYFRKYKVTRNGIIASLAISGVIVGAIMYGIIPGVIQIASKFELLFVNSFGLPYNVGVIFYAALLIGALLYGIWFTHKHKKVLWNTVIICTTVILIGYSSFAMIVIRSSANPPMDQNNPDDVFSLLYYLNREQYGARPLFAGQYYNSPLDNQQRFLKGKKVYAQRNGKYEVINQKQIPNYDSDFTTILPRMWSSEPRHIQEYKKWANIKGTKMRHVSEDGESELIVKPTFGENLLFMIRYQFGHMYFRYFMWNFAGRQNDIQGHGDILSGNWISGIDFIDEARLGSQKDLPKKYADNPGRNKYYFFPLILGLLGIFFQYNRGKKGKQDLWVVFLLFAMTGIAIVFYLNQYPLQPRERDYAFAGSFYAFAIWIGLGVLYLIELLNKWTPKQISTAIATVASLVLVPGIMASENWDDHDRSNRYAARDFGRNYLESCAPNAIIFTNGDNDTFPLWYNQDVEGVRTDVRVCNLSYLQTDWYIDQMKRKAWDSDPLPITFNQDQYAEGKREISYLFEDPRVNRSISLKEAVDFIKSDKPATKLRQYDNASYLPSKKLYYPVDKKAVLENGVVSLKDTALIEDTITINFGKKNYLSKDELMVLDMIQSNNWKRPIYIAITVGQDKYLGLKEYFQIEGLAYRFSPIKSSKKQLLTGRVNVDAMYDNIMNKFKWGNIDDPNVYLDENLRRMAMNIRNNFVRLSEALILEGRNKQAIEVLDKCQKIVSVDKVQYEYFGLLMAENYFKAGATDKGVAIMRKMKEDFAQELNYYLSLAPHFMNSIDGEIQSPLYILREMATVAQEYKQEEVIKELQETFTKYYEMYATSAQ